MLPYNPYTLRVSPKTISFTLAFKEAFIDGHNKGHGSRLQIKEKRQQAFDKAKQALTAVSMIRFLPHCVGLIHRQTVL